MKKSWWTYFGLLLVSLIGGTSLGRCESSIASTNAWLRNLLDSLERPIGADFLYNMSCHIIDESFYSINCDDTTNADTWFYLYDEMYNSAYNQQALITSDSILTLANLFFADTIPIGVIDWRYAQMSNEIFQVPISSHYRYDSIQEKLYNYPIDHTREAYDFGEVFMASPLERQTKTLTPTFIFDFSFIFADNSCTSGGEYWYCEIDLGDGTGFHQINVASEQSTITAEYPEDGIYYIIVRTYAGGEDLKYSISSIHVSQEYTTDIPCESIDEISDSLHIYKFETECYTGEDKYIFILSGYNPKSFYNKGVRTPEQLYKKYVINGLLEPLKDFGYTFIIIDYVDPNDDIRKNAMRFIKVLEFYRCYADGNEQFVVIGHSMGALVGRYALTYMESNPHTYYDCNEEKLHNTRLFISNDGPHQGVNIPISLQCLYGDISNDSWFGSVIDLLNAKSRLNINLSNTLLNGISVKQMLYYHYSMGIDSGTFTAHPLHTEFLRSLDSIGNHPQYCKMVALSNGSIKGTHQRNYYSIDDIGEERAAGDILLSACLSMGISIFGFQWEEYISINAISNPVNGGYLGDVQCGTYSPHLQFRNGYLSLVRSNRILKERTFYSNQELKPYCISAGGNEYAYSFGFNTDFPTLWIWADLGLIGASVGMADGTFTIGVRQGIPWLLDSYAGISFYSDGLGFGFVPVQSAFDFKRGEDALDTDYTITQGSDLFENTPFDVVIGRAPNDDEYCLGCENYNHEKIFNPSIRSSGGGSNNGSYIESDSVSRLLAREIGDEDLYLDNYTLHHSATYSASSSVYLSNSTISTRNPYYTYPDLEVTDPAIIIPYTYSRADGLSTVNNDIELTIYAPNGVYVDNSPIHYDSYYDRDYPCLSNNTHRIRHSNNQILEKIPEKETKDIIQITIYTTDGRHISTYRCSSIEQSLYDIPLNGSIYILKALYNNGQEKVYKLIPRQ